MKSFKQFVFLESEQPISDKNPVEVDAYHGSGTADIPEFKEGHARLPNDHYGGGVGYFTNKRKVSETYAKAMSKKTGTPTVYSARLKMNHVFDVDHEFTGDKLKHVMPDDEKEHENFARSAGLMPPGSDRYKVLSDLKRGNVKLTGKQVFFGLSRGGVNTAKARDHLKKKGYDGLRYNGGENMNMERHDVYIPYHAKSIEIKNREKLENK